MRELTITKGVLEGKNGLQNCKSKDSFSLGIFEKKAGLARG